MRGDATLNRERLLDAARVAVRREGLRVPLGTIAAEAGVGIATLYRHYPDREALLRALATRSYEMVLAAAETAEASSTSGMAALLAFLDRTIEHGDQLVLPLHDHLITSDPETVQLRHSISAVIDRMVRRAQRQGDVRRGAAGGDIIVMGAMLARPLMHLPDWPQQARRTARVYLDGLRPQAPTPLHGRALTRAVLEAGFTQDS